MKNFFHKYRLYISIAAYFTVAVVISYFGIQTLVNMINDNANSYQKKLVDEDSRKKRLSDLPRLKEQYEMIGQEGKRTDLLLNKDATIDLIKHIEEIGSQTGNSVKIQIDEKLSNFGIEGDKKAIKKDPKKDKGELLLDQFSEFKYLDVKLMVEGKYNNIANFIKKLENIEYHSDIIVVSLKKPENSENINSSSGLFGVAAPSESGSQTENLRDSDLLDGNIEAIFYLK